MKIEQVPDDRQPQPQSALRACRRAVRLAKSIEDVRQEFGFNAQASVSDRNVCLRIHRVNPNAHPTMLGRKLNRVAEQVPEDLLQAIWIAHHWKRARPEINLKINLFGLQPRPYRIDCRLNHSCQIDHSQIDLKLATNDA